MELEQSILDAFASRPGEYLSGGQLSAQLGCSRTAVWKHIESLRKQGYTFEAIPRKGYRLIEKPQRLTASSLLPLLRTKTMGRQLKIYDEVQSTQTIGHELAAEGAAEGTLILAERQTVGRGRMGRSWHSPKGKGIWMSLILRPNIQVHFTPQLTLLAAVAVCRAIRRVANVPADIKWPNDLLIAGKKVCGILLESSAEDVRLRYVVAGIGISVNLEHSDYPAELREVATSLRIAAGKPIDRAELAASVLEQFEQLYGLYHEEGFEPIRTSWEALTVSLGKPITARTPQGAVEGTAESIDEMGALMIRRKDGTITKVYSAEF